MELAVSLFWRGGRGICAQSSLTERGLLSSVKLKIRMITRKMYLSLRGSSDITREWHLSRKSAHSFPFTSLLSSSLKKKKNIATGKDAFPMVHNNKITQAHITPSKLGWLITHHQKHQSNNQCHVCLSTLIVLRDS